MNIVDCCEEKRDSQKNTMKVCDDLKKGKYNDHQNLLHQQQQQQQTHDPSGNICQGCTMFLRRLGNECSFKCLFVLILSFSVLLSGIFWLFPRLTMKNGFDAKDEIKHSASVQAYFRLEKPVTQLIPFFKILEYDINSEIAVPNTKVAILSMHHSVAPNLTDVVFGVLSNPMNVSINPGSLSILRSSFIELFFQKSNLTLTTSIFGNASMFKIIKFSGGVTVIPEQIVSISQIPQVLFNFTIDASISKVLDKFVEMRDQLKFGLYLKSDEEVFVQITNVKGSTIASPIVVQASVMSRYGDILPQRLKQLAESIRGSQAKNLGLDYSVFGWVNEIRLSSFLEGTLHAMSSSSSPSPSPSPSYSPTSSPAPSIVTEHPLDPSPISGFTYSPISSPEPYSKPSFSPDYLPHASAPVSQSVSPIAKTAPYLPTAEAFLGSKPSQVK